MFNLNFRKFFVSAALVCAYSSPSTAVACDSVIDDSLRVAIYHHDIPGVKTAIQNGACLDNELSTVNTPLYIAAYMGFVDIAELLMESGALPNGSGFGETPMHIAAARGRLGVVSKLQSHGASVDPVNGYSPLRAASSAGHLEVVLFLLGKGANPNLAVVDGFYSSFPLQSAMEFNGDEHIVKALLQAGAEVDGVAGGISAIKWAIATNKVASFDILRQHGASLQGGLRYLNDNAYFAKLLLAAGEDPNKIVDTLYRRTIIFFQNDPATLVALIEGGADIRIRDTDGDTTLHNRISSSEGPAARVLIDAGADVDAQNNAGYTAIMNWAKRSCNTYFNDCFALDYALTHRDHINIDLSDHDGVSALMLLVSQTYGSTQNGFPTHFDRIRKFVQFGADVNAVDLKGKRVIDYTLDEGVKKLLADLGAH